MYDYLNGNPVGVVNDFDLATWVGHSTTNNDQTGTIPFMAIDLLNGGLEEGIPRLYRHDLESFSWILAFVSASLIGFDGSKIKICLVPGVDAWFRDEDARDRRAHTLSKEGFHADYGWQPTISAGYYPYFHVIRRITQYWSELYISRRPPIQFFKPGEIPASRGPVATEPERDDPERSLSLFIEYLEKLDAGEVFEEVKTDLLEAIKTPLPTCS